MSQLLEKAGIEAIHFSVSGLSEGTSGLDHKGITEFIIDFIVDKFPTAAKQ